MKTLKRSLYLFFLSLFVFTYAHAERDLNSILTGTYAINTNWVCTAFSPVFIPQSTSQLTSEGEITYFGDGTATESGKFAVSTQLSLGGTFGDIGNYTCDWAYEVNDDPALDCNPSPPPPVPPPLLTPVGCDLRYQGTCQVNSFGSGGVFNTLLDQVWYGKIGRKGDGRLGNDKKSDIILINRHDGNPEREFDDSGGGEPSPFSICGKTGTQVKIRDALPRE